MKKEIIEEWAKETVMKVVIIFVKKASPRQLELAKGIIHNAMNKIDEQAKKEVFDNIDKNATYEEEGIRWIDYREYLKIKNQHNKKD